MDDIGQYLQVLVFVAHKEQANGDSAPAGEGPDTAPPPLRRNGIVLYALLPRIDRFGALAKILGQNGVTVLTSEKLSAFLLRSARAGRVELVELVIRVGHHLVDSAGQLIVSTDSFNLDILPVLLVRHIVDESLHPGQFKANTRLPLSDEINFKIMSVLVAAGPDIKHRHEEGGTLLHFALRRKCPELAVLLVQSGAQVDAPTNRGDTPLHLALNTVIPSTEILTCLLDSGANVNAANAYGVTPFLQAIREHGYSPDIIRQFLDKGGDVNSEAPIGSALQLAAEAAPHCLSLILSRGPDLEKNKRAFRKILKSRGNRYHSEAVQQLSNYGFKLEPEDANDVELLKAVLRFKDRRMFKDLLHWGAIVHRKEGSRRRRGHQRLPRAQPADTMKELLLGAMGEEDTDSVHFLLGIDDIRDDSFYSDVLLEAIRSSFSAKSVRVLLYTGNVRFASIFESKVWESLKLEEVGLFMIPDVDMIENDRDYDVYLDNQLALAHANDEKRSMRNLLCRYSVLLAAADLRVNEGFILDDQPFKMDSLPNWVRESVTEKVLEQYVSEANRLKAEQFGESSHTLHDVLNFTLSETVRFLRNPIVRIIWKSINDYEARFPIYWPLIDFRLRRAEFRRSLIDQGTKMIGFLSQSFKQLPFEIREHIMQCLCNHELLIIIDVCTLAAGKVVTASTSQNVP